MLFRSLNARIRTVGQLWLTLERRSTKVLATPLTGWPIEGPFIPAIPIDPPERHPPTGPVKLGFERYFISSDDSIGGQQEGDNWDEDDEHDVFWVS